MKRRKKTQRPAAPPPVAVPPIAVERAAEQPERACGQVSGSAAISGVMVLERTAHITGTVVL